MGYERRCDYRVDGESGSGTALLESHALVIRGTPRLSIPLAAATVTATEDGCLRIAGGGRIVELDLGAEAAKWAQRIAHPPTRLAKLGVKAGQRILIVGPVDDHFADEVEAAGAVVVRRTSATPVDQIFYGVDRLQALDRFEALAAQLTPAGALWTLRPKGPGGISEAETMAAGKRAGLVDVKVVSFSEMVTAEKFVIPVARRAAAGRRTASRVR